MFMLINLCIKIQPFSSNYLFKKIAKTLKFWKAYRALKKVFTFSSDSD